MYRCVFFRKPLLLVAVFLLNGVEGKAEINIVPENQRVLLISSQQRAGLKVDDQELPQLIEKSAQALCSHIGKNLIRITPAALSASELEQFSRDKAYKASYPSLTPGGVVFEPGTFSLYEYPIEVPLLIRAEQGCYVSSGIFFAAGGLMTFLMAFPIEGQMDPTATLVTGCIAAGGTFLSAVGGGLVRLYRTCKTTSKQPLEDLENQDHQEPAGPTYALPALASEIWCN